MGLKVSVREQRVKKKSVTKGAEEYTENIRSKKEQERRLIIGKG